MRKKSILFTEQYSRELHMTDMLLNPSNIDIGRWGETIIALRSPKNVNIFSIMGRGCRKIAMLECDRRSFGNTEETTYEDQGCCDDDIRVKMTKSEFVTLLLDPQTCVDPDVLDSDGWQEALVILEVFYIISMLP